MSRYSAISKEIGWDGPKLAIPDLEEIRSLKQQAVAGDEAAFTRLFRYVRFCKSPKSDEEIKQIDALVLAYNEAAEIFRSQP